MICIEKAHSSAMIALMVPAEAATGLDVLRGMILPEVAFLEKVPVEELHITLFYLGPVLDISEPDQVKLNEIVGGYAVEWFADHGDTPIQVEIRGVGRFNDVGEDRSAVFFLVEGEELAEFRQSLCKKLCDAGFSFQRKAQFVPHITMGYIEKDALLVAQTFPDIPLEFSDVTLCLGDSQSQYRFSQRAVKAIELDTPQDGFFIFKEASGRSRWVLCSSNGFEDRDGECVSVKSLEKDCARADQEALIVGEKAYGPLRFWHMGDVVFERPGDWRSATAGPGWDLGMCDFNIMHKGFLIESGTFFKEEYAEVLSKVAKSLRVSIGFAKPPDQPDSEGVYSEIRRYERSLVPLQYALPSNRFTFVSI